MFSSPVFKVIRFVEIKQVSDVMLDNASKTAVENNEEYFNYPLNCLHTAKILESNRLL